MNENAKARGEDEDLLAEWSELKAPVNRMGAADGRGHLWVVPVMVLYAGFFFGPFITALTAILVCKGRIGLRQGALIIGITGTAWCFLQGVSIFNGGTWSEYALQGMRSGTNFVAGIGMYVVVRNTAVMDNRATIWTALGTLVYLLVAIIGFLFLPADILIAMGR